MGCLCGSSNEQKTTKEPSVKSEQKDKTLDFISEPGSFPKINSMTDIGSVGTFNSLVIPLTLENSLIKYKNFNNIDLSDSNIFNDTNKFLESAKSKIENYEIFYDRLIGKGGFGKVYFGKDKISQEQVAIKIEEENNNINNNINFSYLLNEYKVYETLKGYNHIPKIYDCFKKDNNNYLVMEILGPSLESTFKKYNKKFSLSTVLNIGLQILDILEYIHSKNIIHKDIKPDCFLIGNNDKSKIFIIDFGFSTNYIDPNLNLHYPLMVGSFVGSYKFTSFNSIVLGYNKSRRDDIESLAYMLIYFLKGSLPWDNKVNKADIQNKRRKISIEMLCLNVPIEIKQFLSYAYNLKFIEKPDYNYLRNLLTNCAKNNNLTLTKNNYDWILNENIEKLENKIFSTLNNEEFDNVSAIANSVVGKKERERIETYYIKTENSFKINNILRTKGPSGLNDEDYKTYFALNQAINNYVTEEDYLVHRYVDNNYIKNVFNFNPNNDIAYNLNKIKEQIRTVKIEKGFMSCYMTNNHVIERNIQLEIKIPKGTNAYITKNKDESEIILRNNTEYQIIDAKIINNKIQINISILNNKRSIVSSDK